ncbi:unnamed protein product [Ectocarpus sp. 4 AP-2014]
MTMLPASAPTARGLLHVALAGSSRSSPASCSRKIARTSVLVDAVRRSSGVRVGALLSTRAMAAPLASGSSSSLLRKHAAPDEGSGATTPSTMVAAAAAAAVALLCAQRELQPRWKEDGVCLCKGKASAADSLEDYARRLQRLRSLRDIFEEYATVNADDVGKLMTCGDFLRAMLCYKYVRVDAKELKRRCARYINPLLGDDHGLISFDEFCFLLNLLSIPAGLLDVAFAAADADGSGTIDVDELERLVKRLAPSEDGGDDSGSDDDSSDDAKKDDGDNKNDGDSKDDEQTKLTGHKRLAAAYFGKNGVGRGGGVNREQFTAFVRDLRLDVKTVECRLYSRSIRFDEEEKEPATNRRGWLAWVGLGGGGGRANQSAAKAAEEAREDGGGGEGDGSGWWSRYKNDTISMADLALTLVSTCHPRDMPVFLARVQAIQKKRKQIPLRDALLLHEVLEDHAQDLEDALGMYSKASFGGAVTTTDFARAAKVISGKELSPECVWLVFKMFDRGADGRLQHDELIEATHDRLRSLPGRRESPNSVARFVQCVRGDP